MSAANTVPNLTLLVERVRKVALRMKRRLPSHVDADDLVGAGLLGLSQALANWTSSDPNAFEAYAIQRAMGAMLDELRGYDELTRGQRRLARELGDAERVLATELGRPPEDDELAERLGMSTDSLLSARMRTVRHDRVSISVAESRGPATTNSKAPDTLLEEVQRAERLRGALEGLPIRLRTVVDLSCAEDLTLREIGLRLGVTEARACQLRKEAVERLRQRCRDTVAPPAGAVIETPCAA